MRNELADVLLAVQPGSEGVAPEYGRAQPASSKLRAKHTASRFRLVTTESPY
jgi:hypothetical protein